MDKEEGYEYAIERGIISEDDSYYKLTKKLCRVTELNSTEKILLSLILSYTGRGMQFFMSSLMIAGELGVTKVTVIHTIKHLTDIGLLYVDKYFDPSTGSNKRFIHINKSKLHSILK